MLHIHTDCRLNFRVKLDKGRTRYITEQAARNAKCPVVAVRSTHTHTEENVDAVEELTLSQEDRSHTRYRESRSLPVLSSGYHTL